MNHKTFFKALDNDKSIHDLENLIVLTEHDYFIKTPQGNTKHNGKRGVQGEVDRAYINLDKNYAFVIEYKATKYYKSDKKAKCQCRKDKTMIHKEYGIPYNRIFMFEAFGYRKKKGYLIKRYK